MDQVQEVLKQSYLFRDMTGDELEGLEHMGTLKEYAEFEAILKEGEVNDQLFIINHRDGQRCHGKYLPGRPGCGAAFWGDGIA